MPCNFELWFEYSFWLDCILHCMSISWEIMLGLKQRKVHCLKSLIIKGMCCIVLFRHYNLLESVWPFQWGLSRLLLGIAPCFLSGTLQGHFWGNMPKNNPQIYALYVMFHVWNNYPEEPHIYALWTFCMYHLCQGLSSSAVIWMDIIPMTLANWWDYSMFQLWSNQQQVSNFWMWKDIF